MGRPLLHQRSIMYLRRCETRGGTVTIDVNVCTMCLWELTSWLLSCVAPCYTPPGGRLWHPPPAWTCFGVVLPQVSGSGSALSLETLTLRGLH